MTLLVPSPDLLPDPTLVPGYTGIDTGTGPAPNTTLYPGVDVLPGIPYIPVAPNMLLLPAPDLHPGTNVFPGALPPQPVPPPIGSVTPDTDLYPAENLFPGAPRPLAPPDRHWWPVLRPALEAAVQPDGPTPERLWQLANYDPFWFRNLMASAGNIAAAWFGEDELPPEIPPFEPGRPVPVYTGLGGSVGFFEHELASEFGSGG